MSSSDQARALVLSFFLKVASNFLNALYAQPALVALYALEILDALDA